MTIKRLKRKVLVKRMTIKQINKIHYQKLKWARLNEPEVRENSQSIDSSSSLSSEDGNEVLNSPAAEPAIIVSCSNCSDTSDPLSDHESISEVEYYSEADSNYSDPESTANLSSKPIYKGSDICVKDFLISINVLKSKHNMSDLVFKDILNLFQLVLPKPNLIPKNNFLIEKKLFNNCEGKVIFSLIF